MRNHKLAEAAYEDYKMFLQKEAELQERLQNMGREAKSVESAVNKIEIYTAMEIVRNELSVVKRCINTQAKLIVSYVFG